MSRRYKLEKIQQLLYNYTYFICVNSAVFYFVLGETVLYKCYPLLIHIPLILLICFYFHKNILISVTSVLAAYLLCTPRKWFGTLAASFFDGNTLVSCHNSAYDSRYQIYVSVHNPPEI